MKLLLRQLFRFASVGVGVTLLGVVLMLVFYNGLHWGYWFSSAVAYIVGSIVSYLLNRRYTFGHQGGHAASILRFTLNIMVCYTIAYLLAKPLVVHVLMWTGRAWDMAVTENLALLCGNVLFTGLNFWGQKLFVFSRRPGNPR